MSMAVMGMLYRVRCEYGFGYVPKWAYGFGYVHMFTPRAIQGTYRTQHIEEALYFCTHSMHLQQTTESKHDQNPSSSCPLQIA